RVFCQHCSKVTVEYHVVAHEHAISDSHGETHGFVVRIANANRKPHASNVVSRSSRRTSSFRPLKPRTRRGPRRCAERLAPQAVHPRSHSELRVDTFQLRPVLELLSIAPGRVCLRRSE